MDCEEHRRQAGPLRDSREAVAGASGTWNRVLGGESPHDRRSAANGPTHCSTHSKAGREPGREYPAGFVGTDRFDVPDRFAGEARGPHPHAYSGREGEPKDLDTVAKMF